MPQPDARTPTTPSKTLAVELDIFDPSDQQTHRVHVYIAHDLLGTNGRLCRIIGNSLLRHSRTVGEASTQPHQHCAYAPMNPPRV